MQPARERLLDFQQDESNADQAASELRSSAASQKFQADVRKAQVEIPQRWEDFDFLINQDEHAEAVCVHVLESMLEQKALLERSLHEAKSHRRKVALLRAYEREVWDSLTPQLVVACVMTLGQDVLRFLECLTLDMLVKEWAAPGEDASNLYVALRQMEHEPSGAFYVRFKEWTDETRYSTSSQRSTSSRRSTVRPWDADGTQRVWGLYDSWRWQVASYKIHWTTLSRFLKPEDPRDQIYLIKALAHTGFQSGVYGTAFAQALQSHAWDAVTVPFCCALFMDALLLVCFQMLGGHLGNPGVVLALFVAMVTTIEAMLHIFEFCCTVRLYKVNAARVFISAGRICSIASCTLSNLVSGVYCWPILLGLRGDAFIHQEWSVVLAFAILLKWLTLLSKIFCMRVFGIGLVAAPVLSAVAHRESMLFISMMGLVFLGVWQSYWAFPIPETHSSAYSFGLIRMFRMLVLQDMNEWDLAGVDEVISGNINSTSMTISGEIDEGRINPNIQLGLTLFLVLVAMVGLVFMDTFIALLCTLYGEGRANRHQIFQHLKSQWIFKYLLHRYFCPTPYSVFTYLTRYVRRGNFRASLDSVPAHMPPQNERGLETPADSTQAAVRGCWIVYDEKAHMDEPKAADAVRAQIQHELHETRRELEKQGFEERALRSEVLGLREAIAALAAQQASMTALLQRPDQTRHGELAEIRAGISSLRDEVHAAIGGN